MKFNILKFEFTEIASFVSKHKVLKPAAIVVDNFIYIFNTDSEDIMIQKYNMSFDSWEEIPFKTIGFPFYRSVESSVFQIDKGQLLFVNGDTGNTDYDINYYVYDIEREKFIQERSDKKLINFRKGFSGNLNFQKKNKIYTSLTNKKVKVFYKDLWYWDSLDVYLLRLEEKKKTLPKGLGCCSRRKD